VDLIGPNNSFITEEQGIWARLQLGSCTFKSSRQKANAFGPILAHHKKAHTVASSAQPPHLCSTSSNRHAAQLPKQLTQCLYAAVLSNQFSIIPFVPYSPYSLLQIMGDITESPNSISFAQRFDNGNVLNFLPIAAAQKVV
jgi:hypothetical protein